jgi:formylglycine-generating enzyme required for sulfatase activity
MRFCWVPAGTAQLGAPADELEYLATTFPTNLPPTWSRTEEGDDSRKPFRTGGFWLGNYEVTQAEWRAVMGGTNPSYFNGTYDNKAKGMNTARFPVETVSWDDCQEFLKRVNAHDGYRLAFGQPGALRLPHEDEWEYACRGGRGNRQPFYFGAVLDGTQANVKGTVPYGTTDAGPFQQRTCPVDDTGGGKYPGHPWELMHMHGNVAEWCDNEYELASNRLIRGGSWAQGGHRCRAADRERNISFARDKRVGFRVFAPGL